MKIRYIIKGFAAVLLLNVILIAKENSFKTIPEKPKAGDEVTVIYNPVNTPLYDAKNVEIVYSLHSQKSSESMHIEETHSYVMMKEGNNWTIKIKSSSITDIIAVKFIEDETSDNNDEVGYFIKFYDDKGNETLSSLLGYATGINSWTTFLQYAKKDQSKSLEIMNKIFATNPELKAKYLSDYLSALNKVTPAIDKPEVFKKELAEFEKSSELTDDDYNIIAGYYKNLKMADKEIKIREIEKTKYPKGVAVKNESWIEYEAEKDLNKRKNIAIRIQKEFPEYGMYMGRPIGQLLLDIVRQGKFEMLKDWWDFIKTQNWSGLESYGYFADQIIETNKGLDVALEICQLGEEKWNKEKITPAMVKPNIYTEDIMKTLKIKREAELSVSYGKVLTSLNRKDESIKKYEKAFSMQPVKNFTEKDISAYISLLIEFKKYETAQPVIEDAVKVGIMVNGMKDVLKEVYVKKNSSENGFDNYFNKLQESGRAALAEKQKKQMLNQPAPQFTLTDLEGKNVSLADLKGKVVVVDFWATWCGPCKASFPAMQKAVNKYKDNKDVVFLFVNTWQTELDKKKNAEDFIKETKYTFHVLLDTENKVVADFKVSGIPTKFVIDKNGNIKFNVVGFSGSDDIAVEELSSMIELAGK